MKRQSDEAFFVEVNAQIGKEFRRICHAKGLKINKTLENFMSDFNKENKIEE